MSHHQSVQRMLEICPVKDDKEKDKHMHMQQLQQFPSIAMQHQNLLRQQQVGLKFGGKFLCCIGRAAFLLDT